MTKLQLTKSNWANGWPSFDVDPNTVEELAVVVEFVCNEFGLPMPQPLIGLDLHAFDFNFEGACISVTRDVWFLSVASDRIELRDRVFTRLAEAAS